MDWTRQDLALAEAREAAYAMPLDDIDVTHWDLFRNDTLYPFFERLRREKPHGSHRLLARGVERLEQRESIRESG